MQTYLLKRKRAGTYRQLKGSRPSIDLGSNDTLGLARSPRMIERVALELDHLRKTTHLTGFCATGSRLFSGNQPYTEQLEQEIAAFHGFPSALIFSCGYMANLSLLSSLSKSGATILFDERIHASTRGGIQMGKGDAFPFRHNDLVHLEKRLQKTHGSPIVCTESLFSTDGMLAPLEAIADLCAHYGARLIVDETHAIGVYGPDGKGLVAQANIQNRTFALVSSFAKALGAYGAAVIGSSLLRSFLINAANPFIYTTALPLQNIASIKATYSLFPGMEQERIHLAHLCKELALSPSHIQVVPASENEAATLLAHRLEQKGIYACPMRPPTVPRGHEGVRISLHAYNTRQHVRELKKWI